MRLLGPPPPSLPKLVRAGAGGTREGVSTRPSVLIHASPDLRFFPTFCSASSWLAVCVAHMDTLCFFAHWQGVSRTQHRQGWRNGRAWAAALKEASAQLWEGLGARGGSLRGPCVGVWPRGQGMGVFPLCGKCYAGGFGLAEDLPYFLALTHCGF